MAELADLDALIDGITESVGDVLPDVNLPTIRQVVRFTFASFTVDRAAEFVELAAASDLLDRWWHHDAYGLHDNATHEAHYGRVACVPLLSRKV